MYRGAHVYPQYLVHLVFPCLDLLAFVGSAFLSSSVTLVCFTLERKLECPNSIGGPGQGNYIQLPALLCKFFSCGAPRKSMSCTESCWLLTQFQTQWPGSWRWQKCVSASSAGPDLTLSCILRGSRGSWNIPPEDFGVARLKTYDPVEHWFVPTRSSCVCALVSHITSATQLRC